MHKRPNQTVTHALLKHLQPSHTTTATTFPFQTRHLQIRSNILLISRKPITPLPSATTQALILTPSTSIKRISSTTLQISKNRFVFPSPDALSSFHESLTRAQRRRRYRQLQQIGSGASGNVYLVNDHFGNRYAMKQIPKHDAFYSGTHLARAISERLALAEARNVGTPFIVSLIDAFETATHLNLITELAAFGDLHTFVTHAPNRRLSEQTAKQLFAEVLLGLEDLHRMGYLYRDMKLNNLLLTETGHVRLADFGLAKRLNVVYGSSVSSVSSESDDDDEFRLLGRTKSFVGTRRYMSPEHLVSGHGSRNGYGAPADIWALGVVLYVMLTGRYPFGHGISSGNSRGLFMAIQNDELKFPDFISEDAKDLLKGLLERDALERFEINTIKSHPWLNSVDWSSIRDEARRDVVMQHIVDLADHRILERLENVQKIDFSDCSDDEKCAGRKCDNEIRLLGFGYVDDRL